MVLGAAALAQDSQKPRSGVDSDLPIPDIADITRIDETTQASRAERQITCYLLATKPHPVEAKGYVIITDHTEAAPLASLDRLAAARSAEVLKVADLSAVHADAEAWAALRTRVTGAKPRFVAVAPRLETYCQKMLVSMWDLLAGLDDDPELDVFPGFLVAPNHTALDALVTRSLEFQPQTPKTFRPFVIGQVLNGTPLGIRSLQKVGIMRRLFDELGYATPSLVVLKPKAAEQRKITAPDVWYADTPGRNEHLAAFPPKARKALEASSLLITYGHGTPGMVCSMDVGAYSDIDLLGKVVLSGSCFSGAPRHWNPPLPARIKDGPDKERFLLRAVQNGATVGFGHMKFNGGFPYLFPVLEHWLQGGTVGEGYQRLINAVLKQLKETPARVLTGERRAQFAGNMMLYVVIGDPSLRPFAGIAQEDAQNR